MVTLVQFTRRDGKVIFVNPDKVTCVTGDDGTKICFYDEDHITVQEPLETVVTRLRQGR